MSMQIWWFTLQNIIKCFKVIKAGTLDVPAK